MRTLMLGYATLAICILGQGAAAAKTSGKAKRVEIILMSPAPGTDVSSLAPVIADAVPTEKPDPRLASFGAFRTHDLSRRWVAFVMADTFTSTAGDDRVQPSADAAVIAEPSVGRNMAAPRFTGILAPPVVAIPAWMRGGFAFPATSPSFVPGCSGGPYHPTGFLDSGIEARRLGYYAMMNDVACEYGIPVGLFDAMIIRESGYKAGAYSYKKAFGLTQLMPDTAAGMGVNRYDVAQNLRGGARYLRQQLDSFGQVHLALAAYNAGPGRVRNGRVPRIAETQAYVDNVLLNWRRLAGVAPALAAGSAIAPAPPTRSSVGRVATVSTY